MKKKILTTLSVVLILGIAALGILAYLQDEAHDVNVMTLGNVSIAQHEFERVVDANGDYTEIDVDGVTSYKLKEFTQGKPLYPFVGEVDNGYDLIPVRLAQLGHNSRGGMDVFPAANVQDKFVVVENTGKSDAYVRTIVALEAGSVAEEDWYKLISYSSHFTWKETQDWFVTEIDGNNYYLVEFVYNGYQDVQHPNGVLTPGDYTYNSLAQVYMFDTATNEDVKALDGNKNGMFDILVLSQAIQTEGFANANEALNTGFGAFNATNVQKWFGGMEVPAAVDTADELTAALKAGESVYLTEDVTLDADTTTTVAKGKVAELDLNGHKIESTSDATGSNRNLIDVRGTLTVKDGTIEYKHVGANMEWNNSTNVFNVTDGGVLNIENATVVNKGGSDMAFVVHLNNWGEVTLNVKDSTLESSYIAVRVFNSGNDMNNVTIKDTTLKGKYSFWVHNYTVADFGTQEKADEHAALLNFDIFNGTNSFEYTNAKAPVLYGFTDSIYYDANGNEVK